jgi:cell division protein FtsB
MSAKDWIAALDLALEHPVLIVAAFIIASAAFLAAWWLRGHIAKGRIDALVEQINLGRARHDDVTARLAELKTEVETQAHVISELRKTPAAQTARIEELAQSNTHIRTAVVNLTTTTNSLAQVFIISTK